MRYPEARQVPSPNHSDRSGAEVVCVVLHYISLPPGSFETAHIEELFTNRLNPAEHPYFAEIEGLKVSAHFLVSRKGEVIQFVDTDFAAWHAGVSNLGGREGVNLFSVGIELVGDGKAPFEEAQYESLHSLLLWLKNVHPGIKAENVVGHQHVSPGRKSDPGPLFDWERTRAFLKSYY